MVDPLQLMKAGIHIFKLHQRPRDYVLTFAKVIQQLYRYITVVFPMDTMWARL